MQQCEHAGAGASSSFPAQAPGESAAGRCELPPAPKEAAKSRAELNAGRGRQGEVGARRTRGHASEQSSKGFLLRCCSPPSRPRAPLRHHRLLVAVRHTDEPARCKQELDESESHHPSQQRGPMGSLARCQSLCPFCCPLLASSAPHLGRHDGGGGGDGDGTDKVSGETRRGSSEGTEAAALLNAALLCLRRKMGSVCGCILVC